MFSKQTKTIAYFIISICLTLGLSISLQSLLAAWTAPTATPPGSNVSEPINNGNSTQIKLGVLGTVSNFLVAGNVGIGTSTPLSKLNLHSESNSADSILSITSGVDPNSTADSGIDLMERALGAYDYGFRITYNGANTGIASNSLRILSTEGGGTFIDRMTINRTTGNVGIGVAGPSYKLEVAGDIKSTGNHIINNGSPTIYFQDTDHRSGMIHMNSNLMYFLSGNGNNSTTWAPNGSYWPLTIDMTNDNLTFGGGAYFMEGFVGIGTTNPASTLHIHNNFNQSFFPNIYASSNDSHNIRLFSSLGPGHFNPLVQAGDTGIIFSNGTINTGSLVIGPWSASAAGMRIDKDGNAKFAGIIQSGKNIIKNISQDTMDDKNLGCVISDVTKAMYCQSACNRICQDRGYSGGVVVEINGIFNTADCACIP